ncbi:protein SCO1 homolog 2, mitochondrial isoform X1 [Prosopis cineraria]|uniref:protein SCO1 homolog 2, mitochondrial isoform X1 n=1 Tax=Prosopis cineraria TaxID=364024 RepID=UPI00241083A6|nr:protein SCO1 homolog 2, mitochondrial isoform X1 [Prosopis cineraria]
MPVSRFILFLSKRRTTREVFCLLPRSGPSNSVQSFSYTRSSERSKGKPEAPSVVHLESHASHTPATYVIPAAILGFAGIAAFFHYNDERRAVPKGQADHRCGNTVGGPIIGGPFTLIDTEKKTVTEHNFLGNWVLLYFGYTSSPDLGPDQVNIMAKTIDILESKQNLKILPVFVTIDPQRDSPSQLREYLKEFDSRIIGLTGPVGAIRQMAQEYRVYFKKVEEDGGDYLVDSSHNMYLLNPKMEVVRCFGFEYNANDLSREILKELKVSTS